MQAKSRQVSTIVLLLFWVVITLGCNKKENPDPAPPSADEIKEKDITSEGRLSVSLENQYGINSEEGSSRLTDNNVNTKYLVYSFRPGVFMEMQFDSPRQVGAYSITSGNDADGRDAMNWIFTASNDQQTWDTLDLKMGELFYQRKMTRRYDFRNKNKYKYYRWTVNQTYYDQSLFQVSEWRLFQVPENRQKAEPARIIDSIKNNGLTLYFINKSTRLPQEKEMIDRFFTAYPKLMQDFNPAAITKVHFVAESDYDGVAYAIGNVVVFGNAFMRQYPNEADAVVHEIMHLIQAYPGGAAPGWLSEGIADYVRYKYGMDNPATTSWSLTPFSPSHSYTDAYRITARFLVWIELHIRNGFVKEVDEAIRKKEYTGDFWKLKTGKTVDELWQQYAQDPAL